jgi:uncharacterized protein (DUF2062 family)
MLKHLWQRIASPVMKRLQVIMSSGLTPQKLCMTLCIGTAIGTMPLIWGTTLICIVLAHVFRLNQVAMQSVNYLLYPVQLALLIPFFKLGARMFPWGPVIPSNMLSTLVHSPGLSSLNFLCWITLKSIAVWLVTVLPATVLVYVLLRAVAARKSKPRGKLGTLPIY